MATTETNTELGKQIVEDAKQYVLYSWSVQDAINPIAVERAEVEWRERPIVDPRRQRSISDPQRSK